MNRFRYIIISKKVWIASLCMLSVIAIGGFSAFGYNKTLSVEATTKKLPIYCTQQKEKLVSLSFDAAWGNEDTPELIKIFKKYNISVTFFVVGDWCDKYPESVKQLSDAGHEVMNHSDNHPHMPQLSKDEMINQINSCNDKIEKITGRRPILFRPPYGDYDNNLIDVIQSLNMYCIQWDVDSLDWKDYTADKITNRVLTKVGPGSICLFHNAAKHTPEALPAIIEKLQADGYKFVPISKLIYKNNYTINHEGRQIPNEPTSKTEKSTIIESKVSTDQSATN